MRQPENGAGDRLDGREKTESSAGTRGVKDQQQGAEGPGEQVVFFMDQKIPFIKGTQSPPHPLFFSLTVPSNRRQWQLKLLILIFRRGFSSPSLLVKSLKTGAGLLLRTDGQKGPKTSNFELPAKSSQPQKDMQGRHMTHHIYLNQ